MTQIPTFLQQVQRNAVALISLAVAVSSLAYNSWRNEQSEANRNIRAAGFELMDEVVEIQTVMFFSGPFEGNETSGRLGDWRIGWTHVLAIRDLSYNMPVMVQDSADNLFAVWNAEFETINTQKESYDRVDLAIEDTKSAILKALTDLD